MPSNPPGRDWLAAREVKQRWEPVFEPRDQRRGCASRHAAFPANNQRDPNAAFVHPALVAAQRAIGMEILGVEARERIDLPVVGGADEDRVVVQSKVLDQLDDAPYVAVHATDHRRVGGVGILLRQVTLAADVGSVVQFAAVLRQRVFRDLQRQMRDGGGVVKEERPVPVLPNEPQRALATQVGRILFADELGITRRAIRVGVRRQGQALLLDDVCVARQRELVVVLHQEAGNRGPGASLKPKKWLKPCLSGSPEEPTPPRPHLPKAPVA